MAAKTMNVGNRKGLVAAVVAALLLAGAGYLFSGYQHKVEQLGRVGDFSPPASAKSLRALAEHYASMGGYAVVWQATQDPQIDASIYNSLGNIAGTSNDFAVALQKSLTLTVYMGATKDAENLTACFDVRAKTVTIVPFDTLKDTRDCLFSPFSDDNGA